MKNTRKLLALGAILTTLSAPTMARDEYYRGDNQANGQTMRALKQVYNSVVYVSKHVLRHIQDYSDQSIELDIEGEKVALRYTLDTNFLEGRYYTIFGSLDAELVPVKISIQADEDGLSISQAQIAMINIANDFGFLEQFGVLKKGIKRELNTDVFNKDHLEFKAFDIEYSDILVSTGNGDVDFVLNAHAAGIVKEEIDYSGRKFKYDAGYEAGAAFGTRFNLSDGSSLTPEVFYRSKAANFMKDDSGYEYSRFGAQVVFEKDLFDQPCKFSAGVAREKMTGDIELSDDVAFAKGECKF